MTRPGQLDERNTIYRRDTTTDAVNEEIESGTAVGLRWMRWVQGGTSEGGQALKIEGRQDGAFECRRDDLTKTITDQYRIDRSNGEQFRVAGPPTYDARRGMYMTLPVRRVT